MTDVLQCPYCDLRFSTRSELEQHKSFDHPRAEEEEAPTSVETPTESAELPKERAETSPAPEKRGFLSRLFKRS
jgi:hypothetical protein